MNKIPKRLRIQRDIQLIHSPDTSYTRTRIANIYNQAERDVCQALLGNYLKLETDLEKQLEKVESTSAVQDKWGIRSDDSSGQTKPGGAEEPPV